LREAWRDRRRDGPERLGEVHPALLPGGHPRPGLRRGLLSTVAPRRDARKPSAPACDVIASASCSVRPARAGADRPRRTSRCHCYIRGTTVRRPSVKRGARSNSSNSKAWSATRPARCPAATGSAVSIGCAGLVRHSRTWLLRGRHHRPHSIRMNGELVMGLLIAVSPRQQGSTVILVTHGPGRCLRRPRV